MLTRTSHVTAELPISGYSYGLYAGYSHKQALYRQILSRAMLHSADVILEVSCDDEDSSRITARMNVLDQGPLDGALQMIEILSADTGFGKNVTTVEDLPWSSGSFDTIVCLGIFNHLANHQESITRLRKLLSPSGKLIIADQWFRKPGPMFPDLLQSYSENSDFRIYSPDSVTRLLRKSGFDQIITRPAGTTNFICTASVSQ